jgi:hypothetical protein
MEPVSIWSKISDRPCLTSPETERKDDRLGSFLSGATSPEETVKMPLMELSELEQDALNELVNMGVARAASSLRQMVGEQVLLSVPAVKIVTRHQCSRAGGAGKFVGNGCSSSITGTCS